MLKIPSDFHAAQDRVVAALELNATLIHRANNAEVAVFDRLYRPARRERCQFHGSFIFHKAHTSGPWDGRLPVYDVGMLEYGGVQGDGGAGRIDDIGMVADERFTPNVEKQQKSITRCVTLAT